MLWGKRKMPILINAEDAKVTHGEGWTRLTVADAELIGAPAMVTRRWNRPGGLPGAPRARTLDR